MPFGDGSDGDVVISVNTTLTRDMNYNNLTIDAGVTLYPDGYIIYVKNTLTVNGIINRNGNNASGRTAGTGLPTRSVGGSGSGGKGGAYSSGLNGTNVSGIAGSVGGNGGKANAPYIGGNGGVTSPLYTVQCNDLNDIIVNASTRLAGPGGGGGGASAGWGGGGGSGAGVIYISASKVVIGVGGYITANGGKGANGYDTGGGGGGGGGGYIIIEDGTITNNGTITVNGGGRGSGWAQYGSVGTSGYVLYCVVAAAEATKAGRSSHYSAGASIPGGISCGRGKRRR